MLTHPVIKAHKDKLGVIPNGVSSEFLNECALYQPRSSGAENVLTVLLLGRINEPFKGLEIYLRAAAQAADPNLRFLICVAQGDWSRSITHRFLESDLASEIKIEIMEEARGPKGVALLLSQVDILCLPSFDTQHSVEGYPLVLVEAIASGVFLIVSDSVPSVADLLTDPFGKTFISGDSEDLCRKIQAVSRSRNLLEPVRESGLLRASERYSWETLAAIATRSATRNRLKSESID
jgi:glycosyltransferase involved in cell wall biosynthesis